MRTPDQAHRHAGRWPLQAPAELIHQRMRDGNADRRFVVGESRDPELQVAVIQLAVHRDDGNGFRHGIEQRHVGLASLVGASQRALDPFTPDGLVPIDARIRHDHIGPER